MYLVSFKRLVEKETRWETVLSLVMVCKICSNRILTNISCLQLVYLESSIKRI